jgi:hypothetical protein
VRSPLVVASDPFGSHLAHLAQSFEHVAVEHFGPEASVEALDIAVLRGLVGGLGEAARGLAALHPAHASPMNSGPLSVRSTLRLTADRDQLVQSAHASAQRAGSC